MKRLAHIFLGALLAFAPFAHADLRASSGAFGPATITSGTALFNDGASGSPSIGFASAVDGWYRASTGIYTQIAGVDQFRLTTNFIVLPSTTTITWSASGTITGSGEAGIARDAANTLAVKNGTNAQTFRLYNTTTGPIHTGISARAGGVAFTETGGAMQMSVIQTTAPTVTVNGGTTPSCVGSDTAMVCTIGTAPPAAATFTITFNGTWTAVPSCIAMRGTTGATPLVQGVVAGTTTLVVNLSANLVASEKYNVQCMGVA